MAGIVKPPFKSLPLPIHRRKMLQQQPANEAVAAADFLQEDKLGGLIEEAGDIAGGVALDDEDEAEGVVLDKVQMGILS